MPKKNSLPRSQTTIIYSENPQDGDWVTRDVNYDQLVQPGDPDLYIRILPDQLEDQISMQMNSLTGSLKDIGVTVSTGRVVDFRSRDLLRQTPDIETIPLIYPANLKNGLISWPSENLKKPQYLASSNEVNS